MYWWRCIEVQRTELLLGQTMTYVLVALYWGAEDRISLYVHTVLLRRKMTCWPRYGICSNS